MNFILYLLNSILWALWRRCLGWEHSPIRRSVLVALMFVMLLPLVFKSWLLYAIVSALSAIMWTMGHQYEKWTIVLRYPIIGIWYPICKKFWRNEWNKPTFIDGWSAVAEFANHKIYNKAI